MSKISDVHEREVILKNLNCVGVLNGKTYFTNAGALFFRINDEDVLFRHAGIVCALYRGTRDYFEKGARVMVEIFDDRVDIVSPGGVCKGITNENFGTVSITRNSIIASMFFRINYIEQMGTGIKRMRNAAREANVAEPEFEFTGFFKVTFKRNEVDLSIGHQPAVNRSQSVAMTDRKQAIISFLEKNSQAKVSDFINIIGLSDGRIRALLREMVSDGTIEKIGQNRYAYYVLKR